MLAAGIILAFVPPVFTREPAQTDMIRKKEWVSAKFDQVLTPLAIDPDTGIEIVRNYEVVRRNYGLGGPLRIGDATYSRGLFCHAESELIIRLPGPAKTFLAVIGIDHNHTTSGGRGSVCFSVECEGRLKYKSDVKHGGQQGENIQVDLNNAREFRIISGSTGDGITCDQADWVNARVLMQDGTLLYLDEMPFLNQKDTEVPTMDPPFSFVYDGKLSSGFLDTWKQTKTIRQIDERKLERVNTYTDPKTGLEVRCVSVEYLDFPTVEWTLYFRNGSDANTPILENIQAIDTVFSRLSYKEFALHHSVGSPCAPEDYRPLKTLLKPGMEKRIATAGGRSTNSDMPYFNIDSENEGWIVVLGWPGQWSSLFQRDDANRLHVTAGQELTHFTLLPGEEVRSPLAVVQFWSSNYFDSQNVWRRWMFEHNVPRFDGKLPDMAAFGCSSHYYNEMVTADSASQKHFIDRYQEENIRIGYWWMDAGWYIIKNTNNWPETGTWEVDQQRFPGGLRPISDYAREKGVKTIVWFEPERVHPGTWLTETHPDWVLGGKKGGLLNLGNPEVLDWAVNHFDAVIKREGIDWYRQDFNMDPLEYWRQNDAPDRQGISEIKHVTNYLAYWDALLERNPGLLIDSCASGGRRNDLETMRRSIPLWRTDYILDPVGSQSHNYGINFWIPLHGTGENTADTYRLRSVMCPYFNGIFDLRRNDLDFDTIRKYYSDRERIQKYWLGDYYPLSEYSLEHSQWMAWQFDLPEEKEGMIQVFRRGTSPYEVIRYPLFGLEPDSLYSIEDMDGGELGTFSGKELLEDGFRISLEKKNMAKIYLYKRK